MERGPVGLMTPFDCLTTTKELQLMKLMIPYTPASTQRMMAVFIKFQELQNTIQYFQNFKTEKNVHAFEKNLGSPMNIIEDIKPFMSEQEQSSMDMMMMAFNMMDMMNTGGDNVDPMDMMKGMLDPEQQDMFNTYSNMFSEEMQNMSTETNQEGDDDSERVDE